MTGAFTGRALPEFVGGNRRDYVNARRTVNGIDKASTIANIARKFEAALAYVDFSAQADPDPGTSDPEISDLIQVLEDTTAELKERLNA